MNTPIYLDNDGNPYNISFDLDELIDNLPPGLERAMLRILEFHKGRENAISRGQLLKDLATHGFKVHEREARAMINLLRKKGVEICSTGGGDGGYWLAKDSQELEEYLVSEPLARIKDLGQQVIAMRAAAERHWGKYAPENQIPMF